MKTDHGVNFLKQVRGAVLADQVTRNRVGNVVVRQGYFYRHGATVASVQAKVEQQLTAAGVKYAVVDAGDHVAPFRGDAPLARSSHWWVELAPAPTTTPTQQPIPVTNDIGAFIHCSRCLHELPGDKSPREWGQLEVGFTKLGLQVWCKRHELNVLHIDFEGTKHPATSGVEGGAR